MARDRDYYLNNSDMYGPHTAARIQDGGTVWVFGVHSVGFRYAIWSNRGSSARRLHMRLVFLVLSVFGFMVNLVALIYTMINMLTLLTGGFVP